MLPCRPPPPPPWPRPLTPPAPPLTPPPPFLPPPPHPPLQRGQTPLHWAAFYGRAPVVALLLATPGVDPTLKDKVRGAQRWLRGLPACPTPLPLCCRMATLRWTMRRAKEGTPQPRCCGRTRASQRQHARREPRPQPPQTGGGGRGATLGSGAAFARRPAAFPQILESNVG